MSRWLRQPPHHRRADVALAAARAKASAVRSRRTLRAVTDRGGARACRSSRTGWRRPHRFLKREERSMNFGTIGAGAVALAFAREALARGHEVVLSGRRGGDALAHKVAELGHGASATSVEEAASLDYVLLAVPWRNVESALKSLPAWNSRVLIDATNPFVETSPKLVLADLGGKGASEVVSALAPGPRVVKAL